MRTTILAAAAAAAVTVIATASFADAAPKAGGTTTTIKTTMTVTALTNVDTDGNGGPSVGDLDIFSEVQNDAKTNRLVGNGTAVCTETDGAGQQFTCTGETDFGANEIQEGFRYLPASTTFRAAILGGTGTYQGAYGQMTGTWVDAKHDKASVVFTITTR